MQGDNQPGQIPPPQPEGQWQYRPTAPPATGVAPPPGQYAPPSSNQHYTPASDYADGLYDDDEADDEISWTASEYVAHHKDFSWYAIYVFGGIVLMAVLYFLTRDFVSIAGVIVMMLIFGFAAGRQPRTLTYHLDEQGLTIGEKFYPYSDFRTFSIVPEGAFTSISFMHIKRFVPPLSIYYDPADKDRILEVISRHIPFAEGGNDAVDRLARRFRF